jgi:YebC/PmpR family DNA-binding regulatory protein
MGAQWKHAGRVSGATKRGAMISKMIKEITVAAKGGANPEYNARLRVAIEAAKRSSVPRDNIERALKRAAGGEDAANYETITFEGFAPNQVPVIVECLTDNRNRTSADMRVLFRKGQLGAIGSVGWQFDRLGVIEATHEGAGLDIESAASKPALKMLSRSRLRKFPLAKKVQRRARRSIARSPIWIRLTRRSARKAGWSPNPR